MMLYICTKFHEYIFDGIEVKEWTRVLLEKSQRISRKIRHDPTEKKNVGGELVREGILA